MKRFFAVLMCLLLIFSLVGCEKKEKIEKNPVATLTLSSGKEVVMELYPEVAPQSVYNFIYLANEEHFYDGLIFHRVIEGFMVQGGCPEGTGTGTPGYFIKGEFKLNGIENNIKHKTGVVSMARRAMPLDSAGSQFFICVADCDWLDGSYAAFGKVIKGMEYVMAISTVDTDANDKPLEDVHIESIRVDTFGYEYPEPDRIK